MTYTIEQVGQAKEYTGKYGAMRSIAVKFKESENWVEISQKQSTPMPQIGQALEGTIDLSGQYGPKFKKDFANKPFAPASKPKSEFDNFTMYLSYAKDLVVALQTTDGYTPEKLSTLLSATIKGGLALYDKRPGAPAPEPHPFYGNSEPDQPMDTDEGDPEDAPW